jgi:hypothetical protein
VLPVRWRDDGASLYVALPAETLALADAAPDAPVALTIDRASAWRAREMLGTMIQGTASSFLLDHLGSGAKTARSIAASVHPSPGALVRITARRIVWWRGWTSGNTILT